MKRNIQFTGLLYILIILIFSCRKEKSCENCISNNQYPVSLAGNDTILNLPTDSSDLNGSASYDPDGNIFNYHWAVIAGPPGYELSDFTSAITKIKQLKEGIYVIELKVTDNGGLSSKDSVTIIVNPLTVNPTCNTNGRPEISIQMVPIGTLSSTRDEMSVASAGNKILFAGGHSNPYVNSRVDIYNTVSNSWSTAELSVPRFSMATAVNSNTVYFAGGQTSNITGGNLEGSRRIDIYNAITDTWTIDSLPWLWNILSSTGGSRSF